MIFVDWSKVPPEIWEQWRCVCLPTSRGLFICFIPEVLTVFEGYRQ